MEAIREGREPRAPTDATALRTALITAAMTDADLFRIYLDSRVCLSTARRLARRPGSRGRVFELAAGKTPFAFPGPDREQLTACSTEPSRNERNAARIGRDGCSVATLTEPDVSDAPANPRYLDDSDADGPT